jgi:hypothetical protein
MPLALGGRTKDAVVSVPASRDWLEGAAQFLAGFTDDRSKVERHIRILEQRAEGQLPWRELLADRALPDGRPMPPSRRYAEMLVDEDRLPLYERDGLRFSLDLHNPGNEAGVAEYDRDRIELAIVADVRYLGPAFTPGSILPPTISLEEQASARAESGAVFGGLVAGLVEAVDATFAYADISSTGWVVTQAVRPDSVVHPAPTGIRPWDFLWSISAWGRELLERDAGLARRLAGMTITPDMLAKVDQYERPPVRLERRALANGALFIQYRWIFGSEGRGTRAALDTPLAKQARLRSTHLLFRA